MTHFTSLDLKNKIIAHRGESFEAPENTLASIKLAWERGVKIVEIDVQLTLDKKIIVFHDYNTKKLTGINRSIKKSKFASLENLDVGLWKEKKWSGQNIPKLIEVLQSAPDDGKLIIEIKSGEETIPVLKNILAQSSLRDEQIEIISFNRSVVIQAKKQLPRIKVLYLAELDYTWLHKVFGPSKNRLIRFAKEHHLDGLNVWAGKLLDEAFIINVKKSGLLIYTWTVNDLNHAKKLLFWGIDAVTTDRPSWMLDKLSGE